MRAFQLLALVTAGLLCSPAPSEAADSKGAYAIDGGGGAPCKAFTESRKASDKSAADLFAGWVDGYLSAANQNRPDTFDLTPWQTSGLLLALLGRYCESYPEDRFEIAVNNMITALHPQRLTVRSDTILAGSEDKGAPIYREIMVRVQQSLKDQGYYSGPLDGNYGKSMHTALSDFQKKNGVTVTGLPDQESLFRLLPLKPEKGMSGPK